HPRSPLFPYTTLFRSIVVNFQMPGFAIPNFRRNAVKIAVGGIYDLRQHLDDVIMPVLRKWRIFERDDFRGEGARRRDELEYPPLDRKSTRLNSSHLVI